MTPQQTMRIIATAKLGEGGTGVVCAVSGRIVVLNAANLSFEVDPG
jgi:hypothetical protein